MPSKKLVDSIIFLPACPEDVFNDLSKHQVSKFIKTLREINIAFTPYESQVTCCLLLGVAVSGGVDVVGVTVDVVVVVVRIWRNP